MAASLAQRPVFYFTFDNFQFGRQIYEVNLSSILFLFSDGVLITRLYDIICCWMISATNRTQQRGLFTIAQLFQDNTWQIRNWSHMARPTHLVLLVLLLRQPSLKNLRLHYFRLESDFPLDVTLSRWRPWRNFTRKTTATWWVNIRSVCLVPVQQRTHYASSWTIEHSYLFLILVKSMH